MPSENDKLQAEAGHGLKNSTGTCEVPPTVIGSPMNPRCFKDNTPCLP